MRSRTPGGTGYMAIVLWGVLVLESCWASHGKHHQPDAGGTTSQDAALLDGGNALLDGGRDAGVSPTADSGNQSMLDAGGQPVDLPSCASFKEMWASRENACGRCITDAREFTCGSYTQVEGCSPSGSCAARNCLCERPIGPGDCQRGDPGDLCGCVDSCLVPGPNPCRDEWNQWMSCIANACAETCRL